MKKLYLTHKKLCKIYDSVGGRCFSCRRKIFWKNYKLRNERGSWWVGRGSGDSNHLNNLFPYCKRCIIKKESL